MASAAILVGGRASRFGGCDKSAIHVGGRSILERQLAELSQVTDDLLLVGANSQSEGPSGVRLIPDRIADCGGLDAALAATRGSALALVACDLPFVTAALLKHLLALTAEADAVIPRTERGYHPLCAAYTRGCQAVVARRLEARQLQMTGLMEDIRVRVVTEEELGAFGGRDRLLANVNTQADFLKIQALHGHEL